MADETQPQLDAAKKLLEEHGYRVIAPPCPECKGYGFVTKPIVDGHSFRDALGRLISSGGLRSEKCPKGCPPIQTYNGAGHSVVDARARSTRMHDL